MTNLASWMRFGATLLGIASTAPCAADLSRYRDFQLGADLAVIAKQVGLDPRIAKVLDTRPALIQELEWHPQPLGPSGQAESVKAVVFSFYNGSLFRIAVNYDRFETEGLATADFVEMISATYGIAQRPVRANITADASGEPEEALAHWEDAQYRFDLTRTSYPSTFRLTAHLKKLDISAQTAILEAKRLDDQEAPKRDAARLASEQAVAQAKLDQLRLVNKAKFRP